MRILSIPLFLAAVAVIVAPGCAPTLNIPRPRFDQIAPPPPPEPSTLSIPISVNLGPIFAQVENAVPKEQRASNSYTVVGQTPLGDVGLKYEIWRSPMRLTVVNDRVQVKAQINYWFEFSQKITKPLVGGYFWQALGSCGKGEPPREAQLTTETQVAWNPDWRLTSRTTVNPVTFVNRCRVTFISYDVTDKVNDAFESGLQRVPALVDGKIAELGNFRSVGERAWKQLQEPIQLDSAIWLVIDPQAAAVAPVTGSAQTVSTAIGLAARPQVVFGAKPAAGNRPLPKLQVQPSTGGVHIAIEAELSYEEANRRLAKDLLAKPFSVGGHDVLVQKVEVWGVGDTVVIQAQLSGDINGTIYFLGRLAYDAAKGELYVSDLDYSLETKHVLANAAEWLNHGGFRQSIAERTRFPLGEQLNKVRGQLQKGLSKSLGSNVAITSAIRSIRPAVVYATPTSFRARVVVDGDVGVKVQ
jgi:hypothetical protein